MFSRYVLLLLIFYSTPGFGQEQAIDSTKVLDEVTVRAFATDRPITEIPSAVAYINSKNFERYSNTSILPAINTVAGVRMEERSPGSYRFSIRGSLLRSPFGVRNVKMYWNGLPLTDGGGNTYINLLDQSAIGGAEIIKGPGSSLYGAGTGGVVLLNSPQTAQNELKANAAFGSYGLRRYSASYNFHSEKITGSVGMASQKSDGYRQHSTMKRLGFQSDVRFLLGEGNTLSTTLFITGLQYETPGGLTKAQYEQDPKMARPTVGNRPGAIDQDAHVRNRTGYLGASHEYQKGRFTARTGVYGSLTDFNNAAILNYETRDENNFGFRHESKLLFDQSAWKATLTGGVEAQWFRSQLDVFGNKAGIKDTLQAADKLRSSQYLVFLQSAFELPARLFVTVGTSVSSLKYEDQFSNMRAGSLSKKFNAEISPRVAVLKKIGNTLSVYANVSRGFSPPTIAETLPSTGGFNPNLNAERGVSYEAGLRGNSMRRLYFDLTYYDFRLRNAIVIQRDDAGAEYFVNAGKTIQRGFEGTLRWNESFSNNFIKNLALWSSVTVSHYRFNEYVNDDQNYSGNMITGVAPDIIVGGIELTTRNRIYVNVTSTYTDHIPLNDGNTEFASDFLLLGARAGYVFDFLEVYGGVDNALDKTYSLGNDLNAAGGRYYNAAAGINFYIGLKTTTSFGKK